MKSVSRKWLWPINAVIFNICRFIPFRNKRIWLFGAHAGNKYDDNAKFFFEYVNTKVTYNIRPIWLSNNKETIDQIKKIGYEVYPFSSLKGIWFSLHAGVALYTHSIYDLGMIPLISGAKIVALWHGVGFKKIYNAKYQGHKLFLKKFIDRIFSRTYRNITIATSHFTLEQWQNYFNINPEDIYITGQPRNDVFKNKKTRQEILRKLNINTEKKIILFMPTYRSVKQGKDAIEKIVLNLYNNHEIQETLNDGNYLLLVKLHPLTPNIKLPRKPNFTVLNYETIECNQELLCVADILITDYSSCFVDYSLLHRPIIFYNPDHNEYLKHSGANDIIFEKISKHCRATNLKELISLIKKPSDSISSMTNKIFEDPSIKDSCYSENVYKTIVRSLNIKS
ncbi:MAG: CDP-glycerol glycerophosphotransferase family protein [Clostridia bacterium]|nr:CDP-glycerol glycerophosphotransferase family protein [Clostridia bacterium]